MTIDDIYLQERYHQEDLQRLRGFRPIDDTFMRCLFSMLSFASSLKDKLGFTNQQIRDALSISNEDWALIADKL